MFGPGRTCKPAFVDPVDLAKLYFGMPKALVTGVPAMLVNGVPKNPGLDNYNL